MNNFSLKDFKILNLFLTFTNLKKTKDISPENIDKAKKVTSKAINLADVLKKMDKLLKKKADY